MRKRRQRRGTKTSAFGTPGRVSHDASLFYRRRLYGDLPKEADVPYHETPLPSPSVDHIFCKSAERMDELPDTSVHLTVTSPPYNVGKTYDADLTLDEYRAFLRRVMAEVYRVLVPGGRVCINLANFGRRPYLPLHAFVIQDMLGLGFLMRGEIIWDKAASASPSTAWGSWCSPQNPTLRDTHEYILVFCKQTFRRANPYGRRATIQRDEFLEFTKSVWRFPAEPASRVGHPAPFPVELPYRLIQLYTFEDEVVLDPFMGSGTTAVAAYKAGRRFVGYEIEPAYVTLARQRLTSVAAQPCGNASLRGRGRANEVPVSGAGSFRGLP
ncbi:MAG: site-specific DNA-methyltransferase [Acidobacteria bacterium]|nr:site-specific DNA-methyltransferase [Acidobacteriota bacterium]MDW7983284.1 site-specific DNA-methyltransferase [Acidobacteriota bacterium]